MCLIQPIACQSYSSLVVFSSRIFCDLCCFDYAPWLFLFVSFFNTALGFTFLFQEFSRHWIFKINFKFFPGVWFFSPSFCCLRSTHVLVFFISHWYFVIFIIDLCSFCSLKKPTLLSFKLSGEIHMINFGLR